MTCHYCIHAILHYQYYISATKLKVTTIY
jgi:hypothetical protein